MPGSHQTMISTFGSERALIGMVHLAALPGTPGSELSPSAIASRAAVEAAVLAEAGFDAILIENMHDRPYLLRRVGPEILSTMTRAALAVRRAVGDEFPIGIQVLAGANAEALAIAHAVEARFIRAEGFVFAAVADEGLLGEADAGPLLRYRRALGAQGVRIFCDIKKKHSAHAMTADVDIAQTAQAALFCGADGLIVTGSTTGAPVDIEELASVRSVTAQSPVLVGSGVTPESVPELFEHADALIVGSSCKRDGRWSNEPDLARARLLVEAAEAAPR